MNRKIRAALAALTIAGLALGAHATAAAAQIQEELSSGTIEEELSSGTIEEQLSSGTIEEQLVTNRIPAEYVKPRVGKLVRVRQPLSSLSRRGLSLPIGCFGPCSYQGALVMSNIAGAILRRYGFSSRSVVVGRGVGRSAGGNFRAKVALSARGRKLLRGLRRNVSLRLRTSVQDQWRRTARTQKLTVTR